MIKQPRAALLAACLIGLGGVATFAPCAMAAGWSWPVEGDVITTYKNGSDPYAAGQHRGIDIAAATGTAVRSSTPGRVSFAGKLPDGGLTVTVTSTDGVYLISYLHLSALVAARGDAVSADSVVGRVGTTGKRSAAAPHLHFSVRSAATGEYLDPMPLLAPRLTPAPVAPPKAPAAAKPVVAPAPHTTARAEALPHQAAARTRPARPLRAPRPNIVHAPAFGDSVARHTEGGSGDSARESHASTGIGRVAPPPLPQYGRLGTPRHAVAARRVPVQPPAPRHPSRLPLGALALAVLAGTTLLVRRRRRTWWHELSARPQPEDPKVGSARVLLRDNPDLLRERRAAPRSRVLDDRR